MVFYATFNGISVISRRQLKIHYSCLSWVSPVLGWGSEVSCSTTLLQKTKRIQCGLNPGPLDYESTTLTLSHAGPRHIIRALRAGANIWWQVLVFQRKF